MIILIPLGGIGQRFKESGYDVPKALINVFSRPILYWLLDNLIITKDISMVYIPYNNEYKKYRLEDRLMRDYPSIHFKFLCLDRSTRGASETVLIALNQLTQCNIQDCPIICMDGDNFYTDDIIKKWNGENKLFTFVDNSKQDAIAIYSYVDIDNDGIIKGIVEKQKISNFACTGAYGFSSYMTLRKHCQIVIDNNILQNNEFYLSNTIQNMITSGQIFKNEIIDKDNYVCLGTPLQLRMFFHNFPKINAITGNQTIKIMRYCFDLDNTLVTYPLIENDYSTVLPIDNMIRIVRYLKKFGHYIIISTARRMRTHNGNVNKVVADIGKITIDTLNKFGIPYDELHFGKPYAHFYIDDNAVSAFTDIEKSLGYYDQHIDPRDFNHLSLQSIELYKKISTDLSGEIYYYLNIPSDVRDMFPVMFDYDTENKTWFSIEKIHSIPVSKIYLSELLSIDHLTHIMNSLKRLHCVKYNINNNINIYGNYQKKLEARYNAYDYSIFPNSDNTYNTIKNELDQYEKNVGGKLTVIHGDPVMTNILINSNGKIKFIDMRGKIDNIYTIYGDHNYDWAKLYQSLIGYDEILCDQNIDTTYKNKMIQCFQQYILENLSKDDMDNIMTITKSLLFTLIPLHDNDKCSKYYDLINSVFLQKN